MTLFLTIMLPETSGNNLIDHWIGLAKINYFYPEDWLPQPHEDFEDDDDFYDDDPFTLHMPQNKEEIEP